MMSYPPDDIIAECTESVFSGMGITPEQARLLMDVPANLLERLADAANQINSEFNGTGVDVEQLNNIKKNACSEDCSFCAQSALFDTGIETYALPPVVDVVEAARKAKEQGAASYCLVAAWREPTKDGFKKVCEMIQRIHADVGISIDCSLGFLTPKQATTLKRLNVKRYNHNLETAPSKFPQVCSTHTYQDRVNTLMIARDAGLELCTGGIIGMGETRAQRLELSLELARIHPEEVTVNMLVAMPGTPLELQTELPEDEMVRMFAVLRFLLPDAIIKISGGREATTKDDGRALLQSGANGIITGGYLTTKGNDSEKDREMIQEIGLSV